MSVWLFPHETAKVNPLILDLLDEECDFATPENSWPGSLHTLDDHAWYIPTFDQSGREIVSKRRYVCSPCLREMAQRYFKDCSDTCLTDPWVEAYAAERCSDCGLFKYGCPDER